MENQEIWKGIENYEGLYQVSNLGRIKSLKFGREKILKPRITWGYYAVILCNVSIKPFTIHRLVAMSFIPNPENKPQVNHKWGNKLDNRAIALEWATRSENMMHAFKIGLNKPPQLGRFGKHHNRSKSVLQYFQSGKFIAEYGSQREASRKTKVNQSSISLSCSGKYKIAGGFIWKFKYI